MSQVDIVIRGGTVVDGTGAEPRKADVAIDGGRIVAVGEIAATGREEIDARFADGFVFRDGRITEHRSFGERADAIAWAGIADRAQAG